MTTLAAAEVDTALVVDAPAPTRLVAALDPPLVLEVAPSHATLAVLAPQAGVVAAPAAQGPQGVPGPKGDTGPAGPAAPPPTRWTITNAASFTAAHGLTYPPDAQILTASGELVEADVFHAPGQTTVMFPGPFTGSLYLR